MVRLGILRYSENMEMAEVYQRALNRLRDKNHLIHAFVHDLFGAGEFKELKPVLMRTEDAFI